MARPATAPGKRPRPGGRRRRLRGLRAVSQRRLAAGGVGGLCARAARHCRDRGAKPHPGFLRQQRPGARVAAAGARPAALGVRASAPELEQLARPARHRGRVAAACCIAPVRVLARRAPRRAGRRRAAARGAASEIRIQGSLHRSRGAFLRPSCASPPVPPAACAEGDGAPRGAPAVRACEARRAPCDRRARLAALHVRLSADARGGLSASAPGRASWDEGLRPVPVQQAPCRAVIVPPGAMPGAARVQAYEACARGPPDRSRLPGIGPGARTAYLRRLSPARSAFGIVSGDAPS